jgi:dihydropteroate synthase
MVANAASPPTLLCGRHRLALDHPLIMGVVNVTPDSFSDGGAFLDSARAIAHARCLAEEGAAILDIGGESTRPGAQQISVAEELGRIVPVLDGLREVGVALSVDTSKAEVMQAVRTGRVWSIATSSPRIF